MLLVRPIRLLAVALAVTGLSVPAAATPFSTILFHDTFDTSGQSNAFDFEIGTRQSGSIGTTAYSELALSDGGAQPWMTQVANGGQPNGLLAADGNIQGYVWVSPDHNFVDSPDFRIDLEAKPLDSGSNQLNWVGIIFGSSSQGNFVTDAGVMSVLLRGNGGFQIFDSGALIADSSVTDLVWHDIEVDVQAAAFGSDATVNIEIDGVPVLSGYTRVGGFANNYVTLSGVDNPGGGLSTHRLDNFIVSIPEPTTLWLVGVGMFGLARVGRRRE